jgi:hypothetical protein
MKFDFLLLRAKHNVTDSPSRTSSNSTSVPTIGFVLLKRVKNALNCPANYMDLFPDPLLGFIMQYSYDFLILKCGSFKQALIFQSQWKIQLITGHTITDDCIFKSLYWLLLLSTGLRTFWHTCSDVLSCQSMTLPICNSNMWYTLTSLKFPFTL